MTRSPVGFWSAREQRVDRNLATGRTFPGGDDAESELTFAEGVTQLGRGAALLLVSLLSLGMWAAIWAAAGSLGSGPP